LSTPTNESGPVSGEIIARRTVGAAALPALPAVTAAVTTVATKTSNRIIDTRCMLFPLLG
jgi:hypothetical protein